jgi:hypothetical protein
MRSHNAILRKISEQNLDPAVAHVADRNGLLKPKKSSLTTASIDTKHDLREEATDHLNDLVALDPVNNESNEIKQIEAIEQASSDQVVENIVDASDEVSAIQEPSTANIEETPTMSEKKTSKKKFKKNSLTE